MHIVILFNYNIMNAHWEIIKSWPFDEPGTEPQFTLVQKLAETLKSSPEFAKEVLLEYMKFLYLCLVSKNTCVPSKTVDQAWHMHILRTANYSMLSKKVFGRYVHHKPTISQAEKKELDKCYEMVLGLYRTTFLAEPPKQIWQQRASSICAYQDDESDEEQQDKICKYFLKGKCTKEGCPFIHDQKRKKRYENIKFFTVCKYYLQDNCKNGEHCQFKHPPPCKYYKKGNCTNKNCLFLHAKSENKK